jgi:hypothetical protein
MKQKTNLKHLLILCSIFLLNITGCSSSHHECDANPSINELKNLLKTDPNQEAEKEFQSKHIEFLSVNSYSTIIPGISHESEVKNYSVKEIKGMRDYSCNDEEYLIQKKVFNYAITFNQKLDFLIKKNSLK